MAEPFTIIVDTREQDPLPLAKLDGIATVPGALQSGDYSIPGFEESFAVERKSLNDLVGSLTQDRDRFRRELHRLRGFDVAYLLVEASASDILAGKSFSKANPKALMASLVSFELEFGVHAVFIPSRMDAARWLARLAWYYRRLKAKPFERDAGTCPHSHVKAENSADLLKVG